ncbi:MAG: hypothetical protein ABIH41_07235 [Nanoarchaeota archaeon]
MAEDTLDDLMATLMDDDIELILGIRMDMRLDRAILEPEALLDHPSMLRLQSPIQLDMVCLVRLIPRMHDLVGEVTIIGEEQKARRILVKPSHRIDALRRLDQVGDRTLGIRILHRRHDASWLVEHDVNLHLGMDYFVCDANDV